MMIFLEDLQMSEIIGESSCLEPWPKIKIIPLDFFMKSIYTS